MPYDPTEHQIGHGKRLAYSDTEAGTYVDIFGTVDLNLPDRELGESESTNDHSPDFTKEFVPSLYDPGTIDFTYRYAPTSFEAVETLFALAKVPATRADATKWWRVTLADGSVTKFRGFIKANNLPAEQEDVLTVEASIRVTGPMTYAAPVVTP